MLLVLNFRKGKEEKIVHLNAVVVLLDGFSLEITEDQPGDLEAMTAKARGEKENVRDLALVIGNAFRETISGEIELLKAKEKLI